MSAEKNVQQTLAEFIVNCRYEMIPATLINDMQYRIIDWLGCAAIGVNYPQSRLVRDVFTSMAGKGAATVLGGGAMRYPPAVAALINGVIGHVAELDDGHRKAIGHPGSVTLPVALALGEAENCHGREVLLALIIGYEVFIRLGMTMVPAHYRYWHTTATCGTFAAAAVAASLLKLSVAQTVNMLGIAATMAGGLVASFGSQAKALNIGLACQHGVCAALLAQAGMTGSAQALAGDKGYIRATSDAQCFPLLAAFSEQDLMTDSAFYKVYASCGHTNSPLDALFYLLNTAQIEATQIRQIQVETYHTAVSLLTALRVDNEDAAKFSLPYCIAVAILFGRVSLAEFQPDVLQNAEVLNLARKVQVVESAQATAVFPKRQAKVTIVMSNGECHCHEVADASDVVDFAMLERKFFNGTQQVDQAASQAVLSFIKTVRHAQDMSPLMDFLRLL